MMTDTKHTFYAFPLNWIDTGEIVDADLELVVTCGDEEVGNLFAAADELRYAARAARIILNACRYAGEGGLDTIISDLDAALAKAEGK